jgi:hypothetical protein
MADGVVERPPVVGEVEVLDTEEPAVVEPLELAQHRGEVHVPALVGVQLRAPLRGLPELHMIGEVQEAHRVLAPRRDVTGVDGEAEAGYRRDERLDLGDAVGDGARTGFEARAGIR